ncbi:hypothetical protein U9M48_000930 [Paspalum notatum var. saurae]|uniref:Wall-associated receptor kinase galacturonan-binding domain-containing protein n=1 Tax=Paspalum notatum var. saurae TaxID=547442 RepID=A0AAQ3PL22_PASNO
MPSHYCSHHVVVAAVLWLCAAALAAPGSTGRTTTGTTTGGGPPLPSPPPPSSVFDDSGCLRRCGDVDIPYPFGAGPAANCSASPELRLQCNHTGNGVNKLFLRQDCGMECNYYNKTEVIDIDVIQRQMRVVSPIFYSCFSNDTNITSIGGRSLQYDDLPEPYRFSIARNKFMVLGCWAITYIIGESYEGDDYEGWQSAMAACVADCGEAVHNGSCSANVQGDGQGLRYYSVTFKNQVNYSDFETTYPCAYALLMDSSYRFNHSTKYMLAPSNEFNKSRVPV